MIKVKRALLSVSDKSGLLDFARGLIKLGVEIISTGGTAKSLRQNGIAVKEVSEYTGFPEILDGRVKTLHPSIHAGLLALRDNPDHMKQLKEHAIELIDMVVVNLYPFAKVIQKSKVSMEEALENIDIGGPTMLRAAAKNFKNVAVVCNPGRYKDVLKELDTNSGILSDTVLMNLAVEAFEYTAKYDDLIYDFLSKRTKSDEFAGLPREIHRHFQKAQVLRYGENPHQLGALYSYNQTKSGLVNLKQLHGKELSFNNILDLNAGLEFVKHFISPAAVIIKHNNPTGVAVNSSLVKAYTDAFGCDPVSAFGGIIAFNRTVDGLTAQKIFKSGFMECVIAPGFEPPALALLKEKKNLRLIEIDFNDFKEDDLDFKGVYGGVLIQEKDKKILQLEDLKVVTKVKPTQKQIKAMLFGWTVVKHIKSNSIVLVKGEKTVGIGCGQTSRIESVEAALKKAGHNARNAVLVSEAFIPKVDNIGRAARAGVRAVIQTGGSIEDQNVIKAADKYKIAMVFTGIRHFKH